ncbi:MAG: cryptochrome/photolyase family protein [Pseudomonadota bacterium]
MTDRARRAILVLGDQLDIDAKILRESDPAQDVIVMTEAREEAVYLRQHKKRLVMFFAAMRHFADALREKGWKVHYHALDGDAPVETLAEGAARIDAEEVHVTWPGDWRVGAALRQRFNGLVVWQDTHFLSTPKQFRQLREGRKRFILEDFYRAMRRETGWLMDGDQPAGGAWNFDKDNRKSFGKGGPGSLPIRPRSEPDDTTRAVMRMVERLFPDAPGSTEGFSEPVTRHAALAHLRDFIEHRLPLFGDFQDAIAGGNSTLYHARLSAVMNLKLLDPREVCAAAIEAYEDGHAPLNAVEGFVRQILGWREFIRGVYWTEMPDYAAMNGLGADAELPAFFWTGETEMACLADTLGQVVEEAYAHHIQRLMISGLFSLLWGAHPFRFHEWHMEMYLDAIDWVSLPNTLGMSQHGDGGIVGTKPYAASGAYVSRMSDRCGQCRFDPKQAVGEDACPFTTLYWDFLARHESRFRSNRRMVMQMKNLDRKDEETMLAIRRTAETVRRVHS